MRLLTFRVEVPYWCDFRDPSSINVHRTFPVPPPTALIGLIGNALGLQQDDMTLFDGLTFAICIRRKGELVEDFWNHLKMFEFKGKKEEMKDLDAARVWDKTQVIRQRLINPIFQVYVASPEGNLLDNILRALKDPFRPLYIGNSDCFVILDDILIREGKPARLKRLNSVVPGIHEGGEVISLPLRFQQTNGKPALLRLLVTVAPEIILREPISAIRAGDDRIVLLEPGEGQVKPVARRTQS